jgi:hypothetical protein
MKNQLSKRNLVKRVNRILKGSGRRIETARLGFVAAAWGKHYLVDLGAGPGANAILRKHIDLEPFARKVGALQPSERMVKDG